MSKSPPNIEGEDKALKRILVDNTDMTEGVIRDVSSLYEDIKSHQATIEREERKKALEDVKKAGYGYDDGTGFVLKISYAELEHLNNTLEDGLTPKERMQKLEDHLNQPNKDVKNNV